MVVWLALDGGVVDEEIRYWAIERARRCLPVGELPDGWWTDRPVPTEPPPATEDLDTPTEPLVFGGATISVFNGMPNLNRLLAWGLVRFETAGLTPPTIHRRLSLSTAGSATICGLGIAQRHREPTWNSASARTTPAGSRTAPRSAWSVAGWCFMSWLMDQNIHPLQIGYRSPEQLTEAFRLLTGTDPLPRTDDPYAPPIQQPIG